MKKALFGLTMLGLVATSYGAIPRMAVMSLENKSGYRGAAMDLGTGMADMLVTEFVNTKKVRMVERSELDKVMQEQNLGQTGAVNAQTAAKIGQILGVEYMVIGSVNEFGTSETNVGAFGVAVINHKAAVGLDIRVIDTTSAEIVAAATGQGSKNKQGVGISNADIFPTNLVIGSADFSSTLIGKATREAVQDAVKKVIGSIGGSWQGTVIKATPEGKVTVNGGENAGLKNGDILVVVRKGEEMKDPETGEVLGSEDTTVAEIKVSDVKPKYAVADLISGNGVQANDKVKVKEDKAKKK